METSKSFPCKECIIKSVCKNCCREARLSIMKDFPNGIIPSMYSTNYRICPWCGTTLRMDPSENILVCDECVFECYIEEKK